MGVRGGRVRDSGDLLLLGEGCGKRPVGGFAHFLRDFFEGSLAHGPFLSLGLQYLQQITCWQATGEQLSQLLC